MSENKRICIGEIGAAHGVRGLVKVRHYGGNPEALEHYDCFFMDEHGDKTVRLTLKHQSGNAVVAEVEGVTDRIAAEALRNTKLWINREDLPELKDPDTYYHADLLDLPVVSPEGEPVGRLINIENFGAGDILEIKPAGKPSFYLPFNQKFVTVRMDEKIIVADIPEGLLE